MSLMRSIQLRRLANPKIPKPPKLVPCPECKINQVVKNPSRRIYSCKDCQRRAITPESIFRLRTLLCMSQEAFGRQIGVKGLTVYYWENSMRRPRMRARIKLRELGRMNGTQMAEISIQSRWDKRIEIATTRRGDVKYTVKRRKGQSMTDDKSARTQSTRDRELVNA